MMAAAAFFRLSVNLGLFGLTRKLILVNALLLCHDVALNPGPPKVCCAGCFKLVKKNQVLASCKECYANFHLILSILKGLPLSTKGLLRPIKNFNFHQHGIIPDILRLADRLNWCKIWISIPSLVQRCYGSLERQIVPRVHGLSDVVTVFSAIGLIKNGQSNYSRKGPFQNAVIISLHHMNKQRHVFSNTAIHTV